jgi:hypothetical protein
MSRNDRFARQFVNAGLCGTIQLAASCVTPIPVTSLRSSAPGSMASICRASPERPAALPSIRPYRPNRRCLRQTPLRRELRLQHPANRQYARRVLLPYIWDFALTSHGNDLSSALRASSTTAAPAASSSRSVHSSGAWLLPALLGTKSMAEGQIRLMKAAS